MNRTRSDRWPPPRLIRRSGSITPVLLFALLMVGVVGFFLLDSYHDSVTRRQGRAGAEAVALEVIRYLHPPAYAPLPPAGTVDPRLNLPYLRRLAQANGLGPLAFDPLEADAIQVGPTYVSVTVHSIDPDVGTIQAVAEGIPAARIAGGAVPVAHQNAWVQAGCAPVGIPLAGIPYAAEALEFDFTMGPGSTHVQFLQCSPPRMDLPRWIRELGASARAHPAPRVPEVSVGDPVTPVAPTPELLRLLKDRFEGRILIMPYVHEGRVRGFGRMILARVELDIAVLRLVLAPSAVEPSAKSGRSALVFGENRPSRVSPFGLALRARIQG